jgi:hypothetical protein
MLRMRDPSRARMRDQAASDKPAARTNLPMRSSTFDGRS